MFHTLGIGGGNPGPSPEVLREIIARYPWFSSARILRDRATGTRDPWLELHYFAHPATGLEQPDFSELLDNKAGLDPLGIIDRFLNSGEHRIVPKAEDDCRDAVPEEDQAVLPDEMLTEELAQIYLAQGLTGQAKEIYAKLSLLNPEKSVYFAEILRDIDSHKQEY